MEDTISVVIPVYNVEPYLEQCLNCVVSQSYRNLQIILVDDGSTDRSGAICDEYAAKDSRIIVTHQKNAGGPAAKNTALRIASGEYLAFADADDYVEPDAYRQMLSMLKEYDADVVQGNFRDVFTDRKELHGQLFQLKEYETAEYLIEYASDWTCALLWDKLYKRSLFENVYFEEGHIVDDEFFTYQGIMNAKKIVRIPVIVYNYRKRKSSVTSVKSYRTRTVLDRLDYLEKRRKKVLSRFPKLRQAFDDNYLSLILFLAKDAYINEEGLKQIKKMIRSYFKEKNSRKIPLRLKIKLKKLQYMPVDQLMRQRHSAQLEENLQTGYFD